MTKSSAMTSRSPDWAKMRPDEKDHAKRRVLEDENPDEQPAIVEGWQIYFWEGFRLQLAEFEKILNKLRAKNPRDWHKNKNAKFILRVFRIILEEVPRDPANPLFRQGRTLGSDYKHWRRVKFAERFRLFFRYRLEEKIIVFVWLNDEDTKRKAGSKTDAYSVFEGMLKKGRPPNAWNDLLAASKALKNKDKPK
jgi:toxin YhaV